MTTEYVIGKQADPGTPKHSPIARPITLGDISPAWLADQLDEHGVVRLRDVFADEWLEALRASVLERIESYGDGDLLIANPDREAGSPAHRLTSDPALRQLLENTAALRRPGAVVPQKIKCSITVRNGYTPKIRPNLFHYDPSVLTVIVPIFIPRASVGTGGELVAFGNKRPFRRFVGTHLLDKALTHNPVYRARLAKKVSKNPRKYIVDLRPGDAYVFWGYRQFHGNLGCAPGLLRATVVLSFGEMHSGSWALKAAWKFSPSRRHIRCLQYPPPT